MLHTNDLTEWSVLHFFGFNMHCRALGIFSSPTRFLEYAHFADPPHALTSKVVSVATLGPRAIRIYMQLMDFLAALIILQMQACEGITDFF